MDKAINTNNGNHESAPQTANDDAINVAKLSIGNGNKSNGSNSDYTKDKSYLYYEEDNNPFSKKVEKEDANDLLFEPKPTGPNPETDDTTNLGQTSYESRVSKLLKSSHNIRIQITEANNSTEGQANSSKKYITYTIKMINVDNPKEEIQIRRRYSDFESLRSILSKIFPLLIVPPIPPKNYFNLSILNNLVSSSKSNGTANSKHETANANKNEYSYINSTHLNSQKLIEHRKRLLSNFLNNCLNIAKIRNLEFFSKFLDPNTNWQDEINLITTQLPKDIYHLNPENGLNSDGLYNSLPSPPSNRIGSYFKSNKGSNNTNTDATSTDSGDPNDLPKDTSENVNDISKYPSRLDSINKKIMDNFIGLASDYTELGTIFNSFSLLISDSPIIRAAKLKEPQDQDNSKMNLILDKMGQVFDRSYITMNSLVNDLETKFSETLGEEVQYSAILRFVRKFQRKKLRQKVMLDNEIEDKKQMLQELLSAEEMASLANSYTLNKFKFPNVTSIKKITQYVNDIIDQHPLETRKKRISDLQVKIVTLEKCQGIMLQDISYIAEELNKNFKVFHKRQLKVIYDILLCYNGYMVSWAKKNIEIWEELRGDIINL